MAEKGQSSHSGKEKQPDQRKKNKEGKTSGEEITPGRPLSPDEYKIEFAKCCQLCDEYNRKAADLAQRLTEFPENVACKKEVADVLHWDEQYRKQLAIRKYLQENRMLPADQPVKEFQKDYHIPTAGADLGLAIRNLSKNVSVWKKRARSSRYPDAEQKHAMYVALYQEAKQKAAAERAHIQSLANESN